MKNNLTAIQIAGPRGLAAYCKYVKEGHDLILWDGMLAWLYPLHWVYPIQKLLMSSQKCVLNLWRKHVWYFFSKKSLNKIQTVFQTFHVLSILSFFEEQKKFVFKKCTKFFRQVVASTLFYKVLRYKLPLLYKTRHYNLLS